MNQSEANALVRKHGTVRAAARAVGMPRSTFMDVLTGETKQQRMDTAHRATVVAVAASKVGKSLAEFRAEHDKDYIVPRAIRDGLKALGSGWEYEVQFARACGLNMTDLGNYRDMFAEHVVQIRRDGKRAWAGTKQVAAEMRRMVS